MTALLALRVCSVLSTATLLLACGSGSASPDSSSTGDDGGGSMASGVAFPPTGNQYVDTRRCPACHQSAAPQTTGFMSGATSPIQGNFEPGVVLYGPNLTPDMTTGIGAWTDDEIATAITSGIDNMGERLCPQMSHFPDMQMPELQSIIGYLHSLAAVPHKSIPSKCPPLKQ